MERPSYYTGFAPRDYVPRYPGLWRGCVGAWAPCLGPTGEMLPDWSGFGNHGTLTGMDPNTDWDVSGGDYALDFDGTNDHVTMGAKTIHATSIMSVSVWTKNNVASAVNNAILGKANATWTEGFGIFYQTASSIRWFAGVYTTDNATSGTIDPLVWNHVVGIADGVNTHIVVNNVLVTGAAQGASLMTDIDLNSFEIGRNASNSFNIDGKIDDVRIYNRVLSWQEIRLLSSRRGIAYEPVRRVLNSWQAAGAQNALLLRLQTEGLFVGSSH